MNSIYFHRSAWSADRTCIATASSRRHGFTHADVIFEAHKIRVERGDYNIAEIHLADAIERLTARRNGSVLRPSPKNPF